MNISADTQFDNKRIREWLEKELPNFEKEFIRRNEELFYNAIGQDGPDVTMLFEAFLEVLQGCKNIQDHNLVAITLLGMYELVAYKQSMEAKEGDYYQISKNPAMLAFTAQHRDEWIEAKGSHLLDILTPGVNVIMRILLKKAAK